MTKHAVYRVALLYHDPLLRDIVRNIFGQSSDIRIVAELPSPNTPLAELIKAEPDVVVVDRGSMDDTLPAAVGSLLATLAADHPCIRVIALCLAEASVTVLNGWQLSNASADTLMNCVRGREPRQMSPSRRARPAGRPRRKAAS
jgi:DNA-binding NarL/FixJ family response regulator